MGFPCYLFPGGMHSLPKVGAQGSNHGSAIVGSCLLCGSMMPPCLLPGLGRHVLNLSNYTLGMVAVSLLEGCQGTVPAESLVEGGQVYSAPSISAKV